MTQVGLTARSLVGDASSRREASVRRGTPAWLMPALGLALVGFEAAGLVAQARDALHVNVALTLAQGAVYAVAVAGVLRGAPTSTGTILAFAVLFRLMLVFAPPFHSTDVYRYVWDGQVQGAGINPYRFLPSDPALAWLRDGDVWPRINRAAYAPTIYPPVAQLIFLLVTKVSATVTGMKIALVLFEGVTAWAVLRLLDDAGLPRTRVLVYAWSPLAVWEIAGAGHVDAAMSAFVTLAVLARRRGRDGLAGVALGAAVLVKFLPVVILPALWRRFDRRLPVGLAVVLVVSYLPYLGVGWKVLGFLPGYAGEEGLRDGHGFWVARVLGDATGVTPSPMAFVAGVACLMAGLALAIVLRRDQACDAPTGSLALATVGMVALSPSYPWYFVWLLPLSCLVPRAALLWLTTAGALLYWDDAGTVPWLKDVLYGGTCLVAAGALIPGIAKLRWERAS